MRKFFLLTIFLLASLSVNAQINFQFIVKKPVPNKFSKWQQDPTVIQLLLTNTSVNSYQNFTVSINIKDQNNKRIAFTNDNDPKLRRFNINSGQTLLIPGPELINFDAVSYDKSIENIILTTNSLPEGNYLLCAKILDNFGNDIGIGGEKCELISIFLPEPPNLVSPANGSNLFNNLPQFVWTPVVGVDPLIQVEYRIKIVKILQGQTPKSAIESNIPILDKYVKTTSYQYLPSDINLNNYTDNFGFAWQVQAVDAITKQSVTKGDGKSEVWSFFNQKSLSNKLILISPADNSEFSATNGLFTFSWDASQQTVPKSGYILKIVEMNQGQSAVSAINSNQPVFLKNDIPPTVFNAYINDNNTVLSNAKKYAWQVYTLSLQGGNIIDSSEVRSFTVKSSFIERIDLTSPTNNSIIPLDTTKNVYNFKWNSSKVKKSITNFILKIVPLEVGQTPTFAIQNNVPVFNKNDIIPQASNYMIGRDQGVLTNRKYAWQVLAISKWYNNQVVAESDIWVFDVNSAPSVIENVNSFTIGLYKIDIKNITNKSNTNFSGVGEFSLWQGAPKITVQFSGLQLSNFGSGNNFDWRVVKGEIWTSISTITVELDYKDPEIPKIVKVGSPYVKSTATLEIKGIRFSPTSNLVTGNIKLKSPLLVSGNRPNLTIETLDSWFKVNPTSKIDSGKTRPKNEVKSVLLYPKDFTYELSSTYSDFIVDKNKLELKLNGMITLPPKLKDRDGNPIKIKFQGAKGFKFDVDLKGELVYFPVNPDLWTKFTLVNVDLYVGIVRLKEGSISINTSSPGNFDAVILDDKDSVSLSVKGFSCKIIRTQSNQKVSNYRGFSFVLKSFQLILKDGFFFSLSNLIGDIKIPFLNQTAKFSLQITTSGIGNGVVDPQSLNEKWINIFTDTKSGTKINIKPIGIAYIKSQNHFKMNAALKYDNLPNKGISTEELSISNLTIDSAGTAKIEGSNALGVVSLQATKNGRFNGFPITIDRVKIFTAYNYLVGIGGTIVMADDLSNPNGTPFNSNVVIAKSNVGGKDAMFENPPSGQIEIDEIPLNFGNNSSAFSVSVKWFDNDPVYGKGFMAQTQLKMKNPGEYIVESKIMVGKTDNGNGFSYWFVEAGVEFGTPKPTGFFDIGVKGFTGRIYSKMRNVGKGTSASNYIPDKNNKFGVYAKLPICSYSDLGSKFWGFTDLEITVGSGFSSTLYGELYVLSNGYGDKDAKIKGNATITVSTNPKLFDTEVNVTANFWNALCGNGSFKMHFSDNEWFIRLGSKDFPISMNLLCSSSGYFGYAEITPASSTLNVGYNFDTGTQYWGIGVGFFGRAWGSISFLGNVTYSPLQIFASATLNGNAKIGAYIDLSVWSGELTLLEGSVTANLQATFPNPFCLAGSIYASVCIDPCPVFSCDICASTTMELRYKNGSFALKSTCID